MGPFGGEILGRSCRDEKVRPNVFDMTDNPALESLADSGLEYRVVRTERARSAEESAGFQGIPLGALLRTLVVRRGEGDYPCSSSSPGDGSSTGPSSATSSE